MPARRELPPGASTVEVRLVRDGYGTRVHLEHRDLPTPEKPGHGGGWAHYLARLAAAATGKAGPDPGMGQLPSRGPAGARPPPVKVTAGLFLGAGFTTAYGTAHFWLDAPLQLQIWSCVPLVVLPLGSSRHLPEAGLTSAPLLAVHCWLVPPLQVHSSTLVPFEKLAPVMSRQPPSMVMVALALTVQFWRGRIRRMPRSEPCSRWRRCRCCCPCRPSC